MQPSRINIFYRDTTVYCHVLTALVVDILGPILVNYINWYNSEFGLNYENGTGLVCF